MFYKGEENRDRKNLENAVRMEEDKNRRNRGTHGLHTYVNEDAGIEFHGVA